VTDAPAERGAAGSEAVGWKPVPWLAAVLSLIAAPLGILYVQHPWLAFCYFLAAAAAGLAIFLSMPLEVSTKLAPFLKACR
jgi:hypothetical protein